MKAHPAWNEETQRYNLTELMNSASNGRCLIIHGEIFTTYIRENGGKWLTHRRNEHGGFCWERLLDDARARTIAKAATKKSKSVEVQSVNEAWPNTRSDNHGDRYV